MPENGDFWETVPSTLYKYRDWSDKFHKKILEQNIIWLSSPKGLNDPFDCHLPFVIDEEEIKSQAFFDFLLKGADSFESAKSKWSEILLNPEGYFKEKEPEFLEMYLDFGVFSLCESSRNYLLWSHYANGHKGFCIGFDTKQLLQNDIQGTFEKVKYKKRFPTFNFLADPSISFSSALARKHHRWKYEKEWRVTKSFSADREFPVGKNTIREIYFGVNMEQYYKDEIIEIVRGKSMPVQLYEMKLSRTAFEIEPQKL